MSEPAFSSASTAFPKDTSTDAIIPLVEEKLEISKRSVQTGTVRLRKLAEERTETIEVPLTSVRWQVEHVPVNLVVAEQPAIRQEGDTTVYPVMEERVTILRELVLLEEVRVTRSVVTTTEVSSYVLRREQLVDERSAVTSEAGL